MLAVIKSYGLKGMDGFPVSAEVDMHSGMPTYDIVGLADTAVKESKERVRSALKNSGYNYPVASVVVNLAPADVKKEGSLYDLPIAVGMLAASKQVEYQTLRPAVLLGELSLNGEVRKVNGILPMIIAARQQGETVFVIPQENADEAVFIEGAQIFPVASLRQAVDFLRGEQQIEPVAVRSWQYAAQPRRQRLQVHQGAVRRQTRHGDCRGGRTQYYNDRASRSGQNHAGKGGALHYARHDLRRSAGGGKNSQHSGAA